MLSSHLGLSYHSFYNYTHNRLMEKAELEQIIEQPILEAMSKWRKQKWWDRMGTKPDSFLRRLYLSNEQITTLPENLGNFTYLEELDLENNQLTTLPNSLASLTNLTEINLSSNYFTTLPNSLTSLANLLDLYIGDNQLTTLPDSMANLINLEWLYLEDNPLTDLSILQQLPKLEEVAFLSVKLPRRYWTKLSDWKSEWLLDEYNSEIRRVLIEQLGYERICNDLGAITLDIWREYTLLKIISVESIDREPMVLLKMTCPSTQHIHILRVPPEMESAEAAITWVNHGIHPDEFAVQT
jgi:leucine-rich repeat protein SHOC2